MKTEDAVWHRVDRELTRRKDKHLAPGSWYALAKVLEIEKQVVSNWKSRRVPPTMHEAIAAALGWSVDRLLGKDDSTEPGAGTVEQPSVLADLAELLPEEREQVLSDIRERAEYARRIRSFQPATQMQGSATVVPLTSEEAGSSARLVFSTGEKHEPRDSPSIERRLTIGLNPRKATAKKAKPKGAKR